MNIKKLIEQATTVEEHGWGASYEHFDKEKFAELVAAHEREECAKLCDGLADMHEKMNQWGSHKTAETLAQAIRARGKT